MLPLIPFIAGVAAGVFAANALRRSDVPGSLHKARRVMRDAADESLRRVRRSSARWRERWRAAGEDGDVLASDMGDSIEMINAAEGDEPDAAAPRQRTRRGGRRRRVHREEPDSGFDAEDSAASSEGDAPAGEADDTDSDRERT